MPTSSDSRRVEFEHAGQHLKSVYGRADRKAEDFVIAILQDLHDGRLPERFVSHPTLYFETEPVGVENRYGQTLRSLEWFENANVELRYRTGRGLPGVKSPLDVEFDLAWLHVDLNRGDTIRVGPASMRGLRSEMVTTLYDAHPNVDRGTLEERCVLMVTVDGPGYNVPELTVVGPSKRAKSVEAGEESYAVNVVRLFFNDRADEHTPADRYREWLITELGALAKSGDGWKEAFKYSADSLSAARKQFRRKLRRELRETMALFEETYREAGSEELHLLLQAASLLAYRTMFVWVLDGRGRLHHGPVNPASLGEREVTRSLDDELAYHGDEVKGDTISGALLARLIHTVRAIRGDIHDESVAVTGASIFENRPDNFDPNVGSWLDALEKIVDEGTDSDLLARWDERIRKLGSIMLGHLDDQYREEVNLIGSGADRHRHRVLGNIYEQILKMSPVREEGTLKLELPQNGDDEQTILGAHYTPIGLVEEIVRPTLGRLFRQYWETSSDIHQYRDRIKRMTVVDPAMGSAHFLTVAALEIARELAWLRFFDQPRFQVLEHWDEPLLQKNSIGPDLELEGDHSENGSSEEREDGRSARGDAATVSEDRFYKDDQHQEFVGAVRELLPGVIQRSIYGVDVNPLATELGKLSLWLFEVGETDSDGSRNQYPELAYLDANIRCGDSVVGVFLDDVEETVENALRSSSSFDGRQTTLAGMENQSETVVEKLGRTKRYREALAEAPSTFSDFDRSQLGSDLRDKIELERVESGYELHQRIDRALRRHLSDLSWLFDLTIAIRYVGYTSGSGTARASRLYRALFNEDPPGAQTSEIKPHIESALQTLFETPDGQEGLRYRENVEMWIDDRKDLNPFHWELEFPAVFQRGGFDGVVSNPPFIGSQHQLRRIDKRIIKFCRSYYTDGSAPDYSGFFFHRYDQILCSVGAVGSLATNSIAQATNRRYVTKPLTSPQGTSSSAPFTIVRAVPGRQWPGDANVHFSAAHLARIKSDCVRLVTDKDPDSATQRVENVDYISSYLDEYPEFDLDRLLRQGPQVFQGCLLRGNFSIHRNPDETAFEAVEKVPIDERDALAAYLNSKGVQQKPTPTPSDVVIDLFEPIRKYGLDKADASTQLDWVEENYPTLIEQLRTRSPHTPGEEAVYEERQKLESSPDNDADKKYWWLFSRPRPEMRDDWEGVDMLTVFPRIVKVWAPISLPKHIGKSEGLGGLRACPMDVLFVTPRFSVPQFAVTSSFLFEMLTRRRGSSLKSDLRFTPTDVFPYFPWPWDPTVEDHQLTVGEPTGAKREMLAEAAEKLLDLRTDILEHPDGFGLSRSLVGGPTDLYNLYDADPDTEDALPGSDSEAIEDLRQAHVNLLDSVLRAYEWDDIADDLGREDWTFDRPWLDRSLRFVPPEPVRAELFNRLDDLNQDRFEDERDLMIGIIADQLPATGLTKTDFRQTEPFSDMPIDGDQFEAFMEHEQGELEDSRVRKEGSRWYAT